MENETKKEDLEIIEVEKFEAQDAKVEENKDEELMISPIQGVKGLGGWLVLVGIGLLTSVITAGLYIKQILPIFSTDIWGRLTEIKDYNSWLKPTLIFELTANSILLIMTLILIFLFFAKKKLFTKLMIARYLFSITIVIIDSALALKIGSKGELGSPAYSIAKALIPAFIWIPYFLTSVRVENTFIN